jgi:hypothetical protein
VLPGYDYDVITEEALLTRASVKDGRIVLPDGMSYRVLALPDNKPLSPAVQQKVKELTQAGAMVVGGKPAREVLLATGVKPDFEFAGGDMQTDLDYIHRRDADADIYFVANRTNRTERVTCAFRVTGKAPELWDAVSGGIRRLQAFREEGGRTFIPLEFAPCGSWFVVFRNKSTERSEHTENFPRWKPLAELGGSWTVKFDPRRGGPPSAEFAKLDDWTKRMEDGIRFYSGTATYTKTFDAPSSVLHSPRLFLDVGDLRELAEIRLNGKSLGIVWAPPFRVEVTGALKPTGNVLEVQVVNFWPNRIIGDDSLPPEKRHTKTNIRKLTKETPLMPSGLFGPVTLCAE